MLSLLFNIKTLLHLLLLLFTGGSLMIPETHSTALIEHVCMVHGSVDHYSKLFQQKLRRCNYVTPKNYLDFISTYLNLLETKDQDIQGETLSSVKSEIKINHCFFLIIWIKSHYTTTMYCGMLMTSLFPLSTQLISVVILPFCCGSALKQCLMGSHVISRSMPTSRGRSGETCRRQ